MDRVEKVHANNALGRFADRGDLRDRQRRSVTRKNKGVIRERFELPKDVSLEIQFLRRGLDDQIGLGTFFELVVPRICCKVRSGSSSVNLPS